MLMKMLLVSVSLGYFFLMEALNLAEGPTGESRTFLDHSQPCRVTSAVLSRGQVCRKELSNRKTGNFPRFTWSAWGTNQVDFKHVKALAGPYCVSSIS